jgi:hypothetical protein
MTPRREKILAFLLGLSGGAGFLALYLHIHDWHHRPRCPDCGKRMRPMKWSAPPGRED